MSFADALKQDMDHRAKQNEMNEVLLSTLPKVPERGSYEWWVKNVCRQNTGQHLCDSGIAYGYTYNRPFAPSDEHTVFVSDDYGDVEISIHLPALLSRAYDASDPRAEAMEEILYWIGNTVYPDESWYSIVDGGLFLETLDRLFCEAVKTGKDGEHHYVDEEAVAVIAYEDRHGVTSDWKKHEIDWVEYKKEAVKDLDKDALITVYEAMGIDENEIDKRGFYTYNFETQLDQDLVLHMNIMMGSGDELHIISTHNGCDARGGFSSPVVALFGSTWYDDIRYFFEVNAGCHRQDCEWYSEGVY